MYDTPEFQALRREYLEGAVQRTDHLRAQVALLRQGAEVDLKQLRQEIHKLRGSGGFYGFHDLSKASGVAEDTIILVLDQEIERDDQQIALLVERVVAAVEAAIASGGPSQNP